MSPRRIWCQHALVDGVVRPSVTVTIDGDRFGPVVADTQPAPGVEQRPGLTLAGLANAHSHAFHRALRHRTHGRQDGQPGTFWTWRQQMYAAAGALTPDTYYALARATFAEMVCAGVTCVGEFHYLHHQPGGAPYAQPNEMSSAILSAATDAGLRITLLDVLYLHGGLGPDGYLPLSPEQRRFSDGSFHAWARRVGNLRLGPGQEVGGAVHSVRAVDPEALRRAAQWAADGGHVLHAHVSEQAAENLACEATHGCTPTELLRRCGTLGNSFTAVHATHLTPDDIAALGTSASTVCLCPTTEADLADGIGPAGELQEAGVELFVGTDSQATIDLFQEARRVELDQRLRTGRRGTLTPTALATALTTAGHRSLGWTDAGRLAPGSLADLVTVDLHGPRLAGADPAQLLAAVIHAATTEDITTVTIGGRDVVRHGRHVSIDVASELDRAVRAVMTP